MLRHLMRYCLYCTDNNHDLNVDLMVLNCFQFDCVHLNYSEGQGQ